MLKIHSCRDGRAPATEYLPAAAGTYEVGQPLVMSGGKLTKVASDAGLDTKAGRHYVCMAQRTVAAGEQLPVVPASEDIIFEIPLANATTPALGVAYCLSADGGLTPTTTDGCFTVLESDGSAVGDLQRGTLI